MSRPPETGIVELFRDLVEALKDFPSSYAFIGAVARNAWGRPRTTTDLDLDVALDSTSLVELDRRFERLGIEREREIGPTDPSDSVPDQLIYRSPSGVHVDVLVAKTEFQSEALRRARSIEVLGTTTFVVSPEDLIVYKLIAGRPHDEADIEDVIECRQAAGMQVDHDFITDWAKAWGVADRWKRIRSRLEGSGA